jgi:hypothetical protein
LKLLEHARCEPLINEVVGELAEIRWPVLGAFKRLTPKFADQFVDLSSDTNFYEVE